MLLSQVYCHNIKCQALLDALAQTPRDLFVAAPYQDIAYIDGYVPIHATRFLMPCEIFAKMVDKADLSVNDHVLDIACASGYSTAILSSLCKNVVGLESTSDCATKAKCNLMKLTRDNAIILSGQLEDGHPESGPYQVIFIQGAVDEIPNAIKKQLAHGGKLITLIRHDNGLCYLSKISRHDEGFHTTTYEMVHGKPLPEFQKNIVN